MITANFGELKRAYTPPAWFSVVHAVHSLIHFPKLWPTHLYGMAASLGVVEADARLPQEPRRVFEFGSGFGEGLVALNMLARTMPETRVEGSEIESSDRLHALQVADTLERVDTVALDGLQHMTDNPGSFDLIVAHLFGPSCGERDPELAPAFLRLAREALTDNGIVLINSDEDTMNHTWAYALDSVDHSKLKYYDSALVPEGVRDLPHIVIHK